MASVISLGLHNPSAIPYLVTEELLGTDHSREEYVWVTTDVSSCPSADEEILATDRCVVWSRGGIARRIFRFDVEGQTVVQATLAWFPAGGDDDGDDDEKTSPGPDAPSGTNPSRISLNPHQNLNNRRSSGWSSRAQSYSSELYFRRNNHEDDDQPQHRCCAQHRGPRLSRALVVALRTQAHIYFVSGSSHVVHLPFEVDSILAAPRGVIIKRKFLPLSSSVPLPPPAPPNSFAFSSQGPWSMPSIQDPIPGTAFSTPEKRLRTSHRIGPDLTDTTVPESHENLPRLFCLTDPLMELQPIITTDQPKTGLHSRMYESNKPAFDPLSSSDELLYISSPREFSTLVDSSFLDSSFALSLTFNRRNGMYTAWHASYKESGSLSSALRGAASGAPGTLSRRRSSLGAGAGTGANTPMAYGAQAGRESYGGSIRDQGLLGPPKVHPSATFRQDDRQFMNNNQLASSLDLDFETEGMPARESRRVSSLLARADLATNQNNLLLSDFGAGNVTSSTAGFNLNPRRGESFGGHQSRSNFLGGSKNYHRGSTATVDTAVRSESGSVQEDGVDEVMNEPDMATGLEESLTWAGHPAGLRGAILFKRIDTFSVETVVSGRPIGDLPIQRRIFTIVPPLSPNTNHGGPLSVYMCIVDKKKQRLLILTLRIEHHPIPARAKNPHRRGRKSDLHSHAPAVVIKLTDLNQVNGITDAINIVDRDLSRILILSDSRRGYSSLSMQSPWGASTHLVLPQPLKLFDYGHSGLQFLQVKRNRLEFSDYRHSNSHKLVALDHINGQGMVDLLDDEGKSHRVQTRMRPRDELVAKILEICRWVLPGTHRGGEGVLMTWWEVLRWLQGRVHSHGDDEWLALVVTMMTMGVMFLDNPRKQRTSAETKRSNRYSRSSGGGSVELTSWNEMLNEETSNGSPCPEWLNTPGWNWCLDDEQEAKARSHGTSPNHNHFLRSRGSPTTLPPVIASVWSKKNSFLLDCVALTREFVYSSAGSLVTGDDGCLPTSKGRDPEIRRTALATILVGLHLYREELKLNIASSESNETGAGKLTPILAQLGAWLGWVSWSWKEPGYYSTEDVDMQQWLFNEAKMTGLKFPNQPFEPPSIYDWVEKSLKNVEQQPFLSLGNIVGVSQANLTYDQVKCPLRPEEYWKRLTPRTPKIVELFTDIAARTNSPADIVQKMVELGIDNHFLETIPEGLVTPLREAITACQADPPTTWNEKALRLVGRDDVRLLLAPDHEKKESSKFQMAPTHEALRDVHSICITAFDTEAIGSFDGVAEIDRQAITRLIFRDDQRFAEASKLVQSTKPSVAKCVPEPDWTETELLEAQKDLVQSVAIRTLSVPPGRGLIYFSARLPLLTERFPISGFNLSCLMKPSNNTVSADKTAFTEEKVGWAFFHAGVAAGLSISREAKGIDTSWIMFNKPAELSNRHAGFLLALGLNGHLKSVAKWMAFKYLTPKHTMTSIGLLLGLSASYLGTMDPLLTRLLSVHVTCMLPPGAAELNLSPLTQTTGLMATGLLYCNTQHRRMSEVMLSEIEHIDHEDSSAPIEALRDEGYRLAAGFALGYINLGKGKDLKGLHDMHLVSRLLTLAVGTKRVDIVHVLDKSMAAATIAIALIFMKSHDGPLARKIDIPETLLQFDYVRPDIFLLRTVAKHMIMWDEIRPTYAWIKKNLPKEYRDKMKLKNIPILKSEDLPFFNILAGLCFSIGLRYAGSGSIEVREILRYFLDQFIRFCRLPALNYDQKLTRSTVRNCQDVIALSAATVMAGTGDLHIFRRLRSLHGRTDSDIPYGSHLAAHMAIGILFLGGGTYTFGTSNVAIASLLCALYPLFPHSVLDNKSHLQAFRHFCVLAAEPRCIVPRDVDTCRPISIPIHISLRDGTERKLTAPCLLPELQNISTISTASAEHWRVVLDFARNPAHLTSFTRNQSIYVRSRSAHNSTSSIFHATFLALNDTETSRHPFEWILNLPSFSEFDKPERALVLPSDVGNPVHATTESTLVDARLLLEKIYITGDRADWLRNLRLLFAWADRVEREDEVGGGRLRWIKREVIDGLRAAVWMALMVEEA